jgi:hypothetical protein
LRSSGAVAAFERYGKGRKHRARLNFGDCLSYACARAHGAKLLFKGDDFVHTDVARAQAGLSEAKSGRKISSNRRSHAASSRASSVSDRVEKFWLDFNFLCKIHDYAQLQILEQPTYRFAVDKIDCGCAIARCLASCISSECTCRDNQAFVRSTNHCTAEVAHNTRSNGSFSSFALEENVE